MLQNKLISEKWPTIRLVLYGLVAVGCAAAVAFGYIDEDQSQSVQANVGLILGALGAALAAANINKPNTELPLEYGGHVFEPPTIEIPTITAAQAQAAVDRARAEIENQLGR